MPFTLFQSLVEWTSSWLHWSPTNPDGIKLTDSCGQARIPTELKVLGVLRILGRGTCLDGITELSYISTAVMQQFYHRWCAKFVEDIFPLHVCMPVTKNDVAKVMGEYIALGLPGAICSMDVVHIHWDRCCYSEQLLYNGKEGYPTVAYEMACSHDGRFVSTTPGWYGSWNDKTIVQFDPLPLLLQENSAYSDVVFEVRTGPDSTESLTGP